MFFFLTQPFGFRQIKSWIYAHELGALHIYFVTVANRPYYIYDPSPVNVVFFN